MYTELKTRGIRVYQGVRVEGVSVKYHYEDPVGSLSLEHMTHHC